MEVIVPSFLICFPVNLGQFLAAGLGDPKELVYQIIRRVFKEIELSPGKEIGRKPLRLTYCSPIILDTCLDCGAMFGKHTRNAFQPTDLAGALLGYHARASVRGLVIPRAAQFSLLFLLAEAYILAVCPSQVGPV